MGDFLHSLEIEEQCQKDIKSLTKNNNSLRIALEKAINRVLLTPEHFKPMRFPLQNTRRVHVLGSFVLVYEVKWNIVRLLRFSHHDEAYK